MYKEHLEITEVTEASVEDGQGNGKIYQQSITIYKKSSHKGGCLFFFIYFFFKVVV